MNILLLCKATSLMENYVYIEKVGKGTHGTTYLLKSHENNQMVVCKSIGKKYKKHAKREISILSKCDHKRIIKMVEHIKVVDNVYIILEYANYGTLDSMIKYFKKNNIRPNLSTLWSIAAQVSDALYYLHSRHIIHRDIKPANILINRFPVLKGEGNESLQFILCDFSLSIESSEKIDNKLIVGTPYYMAPEIIEKRPYDNRIDIWALGVILYEFAHLERPFIGKNRESLYDKIVNAKMKIHEINTGDKCLDMFIFECLKKENRISSYELARKEKIRLILTTLELRQKEERIRILEKQIKELQKTD